MTQAKSLISFGTDNESDYKFIMATLVKAEEHVRARRNGSNDIDVVATTTVDEQNESMLPRPPITRHEHKRKSIDANVVNHSKPGNNSKKKK